MDCLSDDFLAALLSRTLSKAELSDVESHLAGCEDCESLVAQLARDSAFASQKPEHESPALAEAAAAELAIGDTIGRYVVIRKLGSGGMGAVFQAYDPELDRAVAIKVLTTAGERALTSEAKALARLTHPNIVAVYEIDRQGDIPFVVMELVDGLELGVHWRRHVESWQDGVELVLDAAAGLTAAHRAGLIHRDVSVRNVFVDSEGTAKLGDFGLAVSRGHVPSALVGTPGFIAPEQAELEPADPRADQYALCATFLALFKDGPSAPRWLRSILERGTKTEPQARFESVAVMASVIRARRGRPKKIAAAFALVAVTSAAAVAIVSQRGASPSCAGGDAEVRASIGDRLDEIRFEESGDYGGQTASRVRRALTQYGQRWSKVRRSVCEATRTDGAQSERLLEVRNACLDARREQAEALIGVLASEGDKAIDRAIDSTLRLPSPEACLTAIESSEWPRPDQGTPARAAFDKAEATIAKAAALLDAGRADKAAPLASSVLDSTLEHPRLLARAKFVVGGSYDAPSVDLDRARQSLKHAIEDAARARDDTLAAEVWQRLIFVTGDRAGLTKEALALEGFARAATERVGDPDDLAAGLAFNLAVVLGRHGDYARSASEYRRAIARSAEPRQSARAEIGLCQALTATGAFKEAREPCTSGLEKLEKLLPAGHPSVVGARFAAAGVDAELGDFDRARERMTSGVNAFRDRYGSRHARVATVLKNLSVLEERAGNFADAERILAEVVSIRREVLPPDHPRLASALQSIGAMQIELNKLDLARTHLDEALAIARRAHPPFHPEVGFALNDLGDLERAAGNLERAHSHLTEAVDLFAKRERPLPDIVTSLAIRAQVLEAQGKPKAALADLDKSLTIDGLQPETVAELERRRAELKKRKKLP